MRTCNACGESVRDVDVFCTSCGRGMPAVAPVITEVPGVSVAATPAAATGLVVESIAAPPADGLGVVAATPLTPVELAEIAGAADAPAGPLVDPSSPADRDAPTERRPPKSEPAPVTVPETEPVAVPEPEPVAVPERAPVPAPGEATKEAAPAKKAARRTAASGPAHRRAALVASAVIVLAAAIGLIGFGLSRRHDSPKPSTLLVSPGKPPAAKWKASISGGLASATVDDSRLYVVSSPASDDVTLTALALRDGAKRWAHSLGPKGSVVSVRVFGEGVAVASTTPSGDSSIALYDKGTGAQRWRTGTIDAFRFDYAFPGAYVVAKGSDAQALGKLDLSAHKVTRTIRGAFTRPHDGKLALLSDRRVSIVDMATLDRTAPSLLVDDKVSVVSVVGETVIAASDRDLVGYDRDGKEVFTGRLTVGPITQIAPLSGTRYAVSGAEGTAVVSVSGRNVDTLWDAKKSSLLAADTVGRRSYVLVSQPDPVRVVLVDATAGDPKELGTANYVNDSDRGPFAFIATKGVVTISYRDKVGHVDSFDLKHMDEQWNVASAPSGFADVVDRGAITYAAESDTTTLEYHA